MGVDTIPFSPNSFTQLAGFNSISGISAASASMRSIRAEDSSSSNPTGYLSALSSVFSSSSAFAFALALASSSAAFTFASTSAFLRFSTSAIAFHCSNSCLAASMAALCSLAAAIFSATVAPGLGLEDSSFFKAASLSLTVLSTTERAMSSSPSVCSTMASHAVGASVCVYCGSPVCASFGMRSNADSPLSS